VIRPSNPPRPVVVARPNRIRIERAGPGEPWLVRLEGEDGEPWPYPQLADAVEDARRYLASHGGGDLVIDAERVTTTRVEAGRVAH